MTRLSRPFVAGAGALATLSLAAPWASAAPGDRYAYDQHGDKNFMTNTNVLERFSPTGSNNQSYLVTSPRAQADAAFTTEPVTVDGVREAAWDTATAYPIGNAFNATMTADAPDASTHGTVRLLWDGPVLYALVEVTGDTTRSDSGNPSWTGATYTPATDGLFVFMDVFNDKWGMETDTQGVFFLGADPAASGVASFNNFGIPSLGSFFNPNHQDYSSRLKDFASSGYTEGDASYTYEVALQIEGWGDAWERELTNGTQVGLELAVYDQGQSFTYWSKSEVFAGREGSSNLPNSERVRNRDWAEVTLAGWDGEEHAYSGWPAEENIRFWSSKNNPGGSGNGTGSTTSGDESQVWTASSKARMIAAKDAYLEIREDGSATRAQKEAAVREVTEAFAALRWADTRFPDPADLPSTTTIPNAFEFFDHSKGTRGLVTNAEEWSERKAEILELAQFYEYGYKPRLGEDYTVNLLSNTYAGTGNASVQAQIVPTNANYSGGVPVNVTINVTIPASVPGDQPAAVAFGGGYTANGIANVSFPSWAFDIRSDSGAWGSPNRFGTFYTLFPYQRNSTSHDSSILIANATAVSAYLDALELAVAQNPALAERIDPTQAVTKGFSIGGKNAFVAAVFDERVKVVVNGGAGATGPANWRYNAQGQEFDFTGTPFFNPGAEHVIAHGTEGPGNSYRHNRVRETELFRHFMPYGHMYAHEEGAYSYGGYDRLPFDQSLLVATLAPDRGIVINTNLNDFNDGAVTDNMSLQLAKGVYANLGVDPDSLVKFNAGAYRSSGDPHGTAPAAPEGRYLSDLFYGTQTLGEDEAELLDTDPFALPVSDGRSQSPYDYYWGGYNTITGGSGGVDGHDGWYFAGFDEELAALRTAVGHLDVSSATKATLEADLRLARSHLNRGRAAQAVVAFEDFVTGVAGLSDDGGQGAALVSSASQLVLHVRSTTWEPLPVAPEALTAPSISGDAVVTGLLTADPGAWDVEGVEYAYQWLSDGEELAGATSDRLAVTAGLAGRDITVTVTASADGLPPGTATSAPVTVASVPAWKSTTVYTEGHRVLYQGKYFEALWWTQNQAPGAPYGAWQELAVAQDGTALWTPTRIFDNGDQVVYQGKVYRAQWWTRNQAPGIAYGPWKLVS
ncbi:MAG: hypothetical protein GX593_07825 [Actinomycetales bacterium]|nr:hypothetical protein [Actinomycetales bacterium]